MDKETNRRATGVALQSKKPEQPSEAQTKREAGNRATVDALTAGNEETRSTPFIKTDGIFSFEQGSRLMAKLDLLWDDLRSGKAQLPQAAELHNGAGKMIRLYQTQVAHLAILSQAAKQPLFLE